MRENENAGSQVGSVTDDAHPDPSSSAAEATTGPEFKPTPYPRSANAPLPVVRPPMTRAERWRYSGKVGVLVLSVLALVGTGIGWGFLHWLRGNTNTADVLSSGSSGAPSADDGAEDILLVGSDSRTDQQGNPLPTPVLKKLRTEATTGLNTDTIILLRIPRSGGQAQAISIPRDTYLRVPGQGDEKINAAYGGAAMAERARLRDEGESPRTAERQARQAGGHALVQAVQRLTGVRVDHYAEVNLYGFYLLTNAVGGVPVCLRAPTHDKDSGASFPAGWQTVSGGQALSFVRQRKNLPHGDLDRIKRQQVFLASAANQVLSAGTLTNGARLRGLVNTVRRSMLFDKGFDIMSFVQRAQELAGGNVNFSTIPVESASARTADGQDIVKVDIPAVRRYVRRALGGGSPQPQGRPAPAVGSGDTGSGAGSAPQGHGGQPVGQTAPQSATSGPAPGAAGGSASSPAPSLSSPQCVY